MTSGPEKITLFLPTLAAGGAERVFVNLANGLAHAGFDVTLLVGVFGEYAYRSQLEASIRVHELGKRHMRHCVLPLAQFLRRERPAVLFSALEHGNIAAVLAKEIARTPVRVVVTVHQTLSRVLQAKPSLHVRAITFVARILRLADGIVAVSNGTADDFASVTKTPRNRIQVIYNPVISSDLHRKADETLDHPWYRPGQPPVILGVGRLNKQKDFPNLIRAFAILRKTIRARLMILGEGEDRSDLQGLVEELGLGDCVDMPGVVPNPYAYMRRASLFVLSSAWEALPTVPIEAMACGCPVVATDCPYGPREILRDGELGLLVPVGDPKALAHAMQQSLLGERKAVPHEALRRFHLDVAVGEYIELIRRLMATK